MGYTTNGDCQSVLNESLEIGWNNFANLEKVGRINVKRKCRIFPRKFNIATRAIRKHVNLMKRNIHLNEYSEFLFEK